MDTRLPAPSLDPSFYSNITNSDLDFFRHAAHTDDGDHQIKQHILTIQAKAYDVCSYPCIRRFAFIRPKIASLPGYNKALELLNTRKDPILVDIGCCFGNDIRKAVLDGWPAENIVASDLRREFWDIGHELFKSTPKSYPVNFVQGNIFDDAFLSFGSGQSEAVPLNTITTLTPLIHRVSAIHTSSLFHLFSENDQLALARRLAALLLPEKGSIIFGQHGARPFKGDRVEAPSFLAAGKGEHADTGLTFEHQYMFCHSPESWRQLWTEQVFGPDQPFRVKVEAELIEEERKDLHYSVAVAGSKFWIMSWSVQIL
ncbi:hypothetical protein CPC08DRAFT_630136 [Agrocybe pediades]|nr:hypothetical protein CPC08DRAFT_630136 [Agrocybe pediades]